MLSSDRVELEMEVATYRRVNQQTNRQKGRKAQRETHTYRSMHRVGRDHSPALDQDTFHAAHPRPGATVCAGPHEKRGEEGGKEEGKQESADDH